MKSYLNQIYFYFQGDIKGRVVDIILERELAFCRHLFDRLEDINNRLRTSQEDLSPDDSDSHLVLQFNTSMLYDVDETLYTKCFSKGVIRPSARIILQSLHEDYGVINGIVTTRNDDVVRRQLAGEYRENNIDDISEYIDNQYVYGMPGTVSFDLSGLRIDTLLGQYDIESPRLGVFLPGTRYISPEDAWRESVEAVEGVSIEGLEELLSSQSGLDMYTKSLKRGFYGKLFRENPDMPMLDDLEERYLKYLEEQARHLQRYLDEQKAEIDEADIGEKWDKLFQFFQYDNTIFTDDGRDPVLPDFLDAEKLGILRELFLVFGKEDKELVDYFDSPELAQEFWETIGKRLYNYLLTNYAEFNFGGSLAQPEKVLEDIKDKIKARANKFSESDFFVKLDMMGRIIDREEWSHEMIKVITSHRKIVKKYEDNNVEAYRDLFVGLSKLFGINIKKRKNEINLSIVFWKLIQAKNAIDNSGDDNVVVSIAIDNEELAEKFYELLSGKIEDEDGVVDGYAMFGLDDPKYRDKVYLISCGKRGVFSEKEIKKELQQAA